MMYQINLYKSNNIKFDAAVVHRSPNISDANETINILLLIH